MFGYLFQLGIEIVRHKVRLCFKILSEFEQKSTVPITLLLNIMLCIITVYCVLACLRLIEKFFKKDITSDASRKT